MIVPPAGTAAAPWCTGDTKPSRFELEPDVPEHGHDVGVWFYVEVRTSIFFWFAYKVEQFEKVVVVQIWFSKICMDFFWIKYKKKKEEKYNKIEFRITLAI